MIKSLTLNQSSKHVPQNLGRTLHMTQFFGCRLLTHTLSPFSLSSLYSIEVLPNYRANVSDEMQRRRGYRSSLYINGLKTKLKTKPNKKYSALDKYAARGGQGSRFFFFIRNAYARARDDNSCSIAFDRECVVLLPNILNSQNQINHSN